MDIGPLALFEQFKLYAVTDSWIEPSVIFNLKIGIHRTLTCKSLVVWVWSELDIFFGDVDDFREQSDLIPPLIWANGPIKLKQ